MNLTENEKQLLLLLVNEDDFRSAKYFADEMQYSTKTIHHICNALKQKILLEFKLDLIEKLPRYGIKLKDKAQLKKLLLNETFAFSQSNDIFYSSDFRMVYLLMDLLITNELRRISTYADCFYVSEITIQKDINNLTKLLAQHSIQLNKKNRVVGVQTNQTKNLSLVVKRIMMDTAEKNNVSHEHYIYLFNQANEHYQALELYKEVKCFCEESGELNEDLIQGHHLSSMIMSIYCYFLNTIQSKESSLTDVTISPTQLDQLAWYAHVINFSERLKTGLNIIVSGDSIKRICELLVIHGFYFSKQTNLLVNATIEKATLELIGKMSDYLNVNLRSNHNLEQALLKHIVPMITRLKNNIYIKNPIVHSIKKQYASVFQLVSVAVSEIENKFDVLLNEDENAFLTIHFQVAIENETDIKHVFVVCKQGFFTSALIYNKLNAVVPRNTILEMITEEQLQEIDKTKIDLVVSSIRLEQTDYPVCYVSILPSDEEIEKVANRLVKLNNYHYKFGKLTDHQSKVSRYITQETVLLNQSFQTIDEIFHFISDNFLEKDLALSDLYDELIKREQLGFTSLNTGIAVPHVSPKLIKKSTLFFITLKKPIMWGYNKVSFIVFLALREDDILEAKAIVEELQGIIESSERIVAISSSSSYSSFKEKIMMREGKKHGV